jgi:hypothetical protein
VCRQVDPQQQYAHLSKIISDYVKMFLVDTRSLKAAQSIKVSCAPAIAAT